MLKTKFIITKEVPMMNKIDITGHKFVCKECNAIHEVTTHTQAEVTTIVSIGRKPNSYRNTCCAIGNVFWAIKTDDGVIVGGNDNLIPLKPGSTEELLYG